MAARMKLMKLMQEFRGFADITNRHPQPKQPGLFLMQLRFHLLQTTSARRKRSITIEMLEQPDIPYPVHIQHLQPVTIQEVAPVALT
jgi:hypothetical protein